MCALGFTFWRENGQQIQDVCLDNVTEAVQMRPPQAQATMPEVRIVCVIAGLKPNHRKLRNQIKCPNKTPACDECNSKPLLMFDEDHCCMRRQQSTAGCDGAATTCDSSRSSRHTRTSPCMSHDIIFACKNTRPKCSSISQPASCRVQPEFTDLKRGFCSRRSPGLKTVFSTCSAPPLPPISTVFR
jgi:hypothetical protein